MDTRTVKRDDPTLDPNADYSFGGESPECEECGHGEAVHAPIALAPTLTRPCYAVGCECNDYVPADGSPPPASA